MRAQIAGFHTSESIANVLKTTLDLDVPLSSNSNSMLDTPVWLGHTTDDEVIDIELGRQACEVVRSLGMKVTWTEQKEGGHLGLLKSAGLDSIVEFLKEVMNMQREV